VRILARKLERKMTRVEVDSNSYKSDWSILAGYLASALLLLVIYYLANSPGTDMSDVASMSVFP
jgi:hypothetical protein